MATELRQLKRALVSYGFDEKEAVLYMTCLKASATVLELSRATNLARPTIYPILESLRLRGYLRIRKEGRTTRYVAEPPAALLKRLEERREILSDALPALEALSGTNVEVVGVTMYEGTEGFRQFWQKLFRSGVKEYCLLTSGIGLREYVREDYLVKHVIAQRVKLGIKSRQLVPENAHTHRITHTDKHELRESRFLPPHIQLPATVLIFGHEVAFVTTRKENSVILMASGDTAVTLRSVFELLWSVSKPTE